MVPLDDVVRNALAGMTTGPRPLVKALEFYSQQEDSSVPTIEKELSGHLVADPNDVIRTLFHRSLSAWDWETAAPWTGGTPENTVARRIRIYDLLNIGPHLRSVLDGHLPHYEGEKSTLVEHPNALGNWYTYDFRSSRSFYW